MALTSLIALVNFCTERWVAKVMKGRSGEASGVTLQFADGSDKTFPGWWQVFGWPQSNDSMRNGNLFCALDALDRWLPLRPIGRASCRERVLQDGEISVVA